MPIQLHKSTNPCGDIIYKLKDLSAECTAYATTTRHRPWRRSAVAAPPNAAGIQQDQLCQSLWGHHLRKLSPSLVQEVGERDITGTTAPT